MITNLSLGHFRNVNSFFHRLDPRLKFLILFIFTVLVFLSRNIFVLTLIFLTSVVFFFLSKQTVSTLFFFLKRIIIVIPIAFFFFSISRIGREIDKDSQLLARFLFFIFVYSTHKSTIIISIFFPKRIFFLFSFNELFLGSLLVVRLLSCLFFNLVLVTTTRLWEIFAAFEWLFYPLNLIGINTHVFTFVGMSSFSFIFGTFADVSGVLKSQAARGADIKELGFFKKIRHLSLLVFPILYRSFWRAKLGALSITSKGYSPDAMRTKYRTLKFKKTDIFFLSVLLVYYISLLSFSLFVS